MNYKYLKREAILKRGGIVALKLTIKEVLRKLIKEKKKASRKEK